MDFTEVWNRFKGMPTVYLATVDGDQPRVRLMSLIEFKGNIWFATKTSWNKISDLKKNNKLEFTFGFMKDKLIGYMRVTGKAEIIEDITVKEELIPAITFFENYFHDLHDPDYSLIRVELTNVFYSPPSEDGKKYIFDLTKENGREEYTVITRFKLRE